jgi:hypothetical protein
MSQNVEDKSTLMARAVFELVRLNAHKSKELHRVHRSMKALFHEELTLPPPRPISKASRAKAHAEVKPEAHAA